MATTENLHTGDASKTKFSFTFPYIQEADVKVYLFVTDAWVLKTLTTHYTFANATTIQFGSAPAAADSDEQTALGDTNNIKIKRVTDSDSLSGTFYPGSAIRSSDLNDNFTQNLYVTQEANNNVTTAVTDSAAAVVTADAADAIADDAADDVKRWIKDGDGTDTAGDEDDDVFADRPLKPQGVPYAVAQAAAAVTTANTASTTANTASTNASAAVVTANAASAAVSDAVIYTLVATKAAFEATTFSEDGYFEITNSTGISDSYTSFTDGGSTSMTVTGIPATPTFDSGIAARFSYDHSATTFTWVGYWVTDSETRYGPIASPAFTGDVSIPDKIVHTGDTNTAIRFPSADTITAETAGSERLRIDSSGNVLINTTTEGHSDADNLTIADSSKAGITIRNTTTTGDGAIFFSDATSSTGEYAGYIEYGHSTDTLRFATATAEAMRIDSSGRLGIGNTTMSSFTENAADNLVVGSGSGGEGITIYSATDNQGSLTFADGTTGDAAYRGAIEYSHTDDKLVFRTAGVTNRLTIDSSGNVGIGTASPTRNLHVNGTDSDTVQIHLTNSTTGGTANDGFSLALGSDESGILNMREANPMRFFTSDTEAMRIDSSGRVLVGTSTNTDDYMFQVDSSASTVAQLTRYGADAAHLVLGSSRGTQGSKTALVDDDFGGVFEFKAYQGSAFSSIASIRAACEAAPASGDTPGRLVFQTTADSASTTTERMRITSDGATKMTTTGDYTTGTNTIHEMRVSNSSDWIGIFTNNTGSSPYGISVRYPSDDPNSTSCQAYHFEDSTAMRFTVRSNGGISNYTSNDTNLCDEREKKNIEPLDSTWDCLKNWELKKFHYNEADDTEDKKYGVIAQQVAPHCPEVIAEWVKQRAEDAVLDDDGNVVTPAKEEVLRKGVKEQQMMWMAIKALQEAITKIETLETKVAALEAA